ncbi:exported hypothetical protein [Candidatus Terasakiella magnetica]|nr:exported hypothetical protein [Candidatus Terasakiella magnetica]
MIRMLVVGMLAMVLPAVAQASEARLWIVTPAPGGNLSDCPERATAAFLARSEEARLVTSEATVRWEGGRFPLRGEAASQEDRMRMWDNCFVLEADGRVIVAGATLVPYSARLLRFPVLQVLTRRQGDALEFELTPAFPAAKSSISSDAWRESLSGLR